MVVRTNGDEDGNGPHVMKRLRRDPDLAGQQNPSENLDEQDPEFQEEEETEDLQQQQVGSSGASLNSQNTSLHSTPPLLPRHLESLRRTQILRRLPPMTTTADIIRDITQQFGYTDRPQQLIEAVLRDKNNRRQFSVTYTSFELKQHVASKGFHIGDTNIPAEGGNVSAFIPYPPYYLVDADLRNLLQPYGTILTGDFRRDKTYGIRMGGYSFTIALHDGMSLPDQLTIYDETFHIINIDEKRYCNLCSRYDHKWTYCRRRPLHEQRKTLREVRQLMTEQTQQDTQNTSSLTSHESSPPTQISLSENATQNQEETSIGSATPQSKNTPEFMLLIGGPSTCIASEKPTTTTEQTTHQSSQQSQTPQSINTKIATMENPLEPPKSLDAFESPNNSLPPKTPESS